VIDPLATQFTTRAPLLAGFVFFVATAGLLAYWTHRDATAHGVERPALWVLAVLAVPFGVVVYLVVRRGWERERPRTDGVRAAETALFAILGALVLGTVLTPPDPFTQAVAMPALSLALLPVAYLLYYRGGITTFRDEL
jgi:cytochrome bd-type quinol oxidase subunit 2